MKGDFSRFTYDRQRHYDRVLMQQGRVQTDADWNEQAEMVGRRHSSAVHDLIGRAGGPRGYAGFALRGHGGLTFDGIKDKIELTGGDHRRLHAFTVEGWIKRTAAEAEAAILSTEDGAFVLGVTADGRLSAKRRQEVAAMVEPALDGAAPVIEEVACAEVTSGRVLPAGRFVHVAALCGWDRIELYVDGQPQGRWEIVGHHHWVKSRPLWLGCTLDGDTPAAFFAGTIDRLRLWDRALSPAELRAARDGGQVCNARDLLDFRHLHGHAHGPHLAEPELWIGAGRYYVGGVACDLDAATRFGEQADCPGLAMPDRHKHEGPWLAFLDSWDRTVSFIEDPAIREVALGGPDTALRSRVVAQVRLAPAPDAFALPMRAQPGAARFSATPGGTLAANHLVRVEIHDAGWAAGSPMPEEGTAGGGFTLVQADIAAGTVTVEEQWDREHGWRAGQLVELVHPGLDKAVTGTVASVESRALRCTTLSLQADLSALAGGLEGWRLRPIASFKWSRDNAAFAFQVVSVDAGGTSLSLRDPAATSGLLAPNDWVEFADDASVLHGTGYPLRRIATVDDDDPGLPVVTLDQPCVSTAPSRDQLAASHALLRRWDGFVPAAGTHAVAAGPAVALAGGVQVEFAAGEYQAQDFWVVPVRVHGLEWPADNGTPRFLPARGIQHRYAELALLSFRGNSLEVRDLRRLFEPLAEPPCHREDADDPTYRTAVEQAREEIEEQPPCPLPPLPPPPPYDPLPADVLILRRSERPVEGWRFTGTVIPAKALRRGWHWLDATTPRTAPVACATLAGEIYCLWDDGEFASWDPRTVPEFAWTRRRGLPGGIAAGTRMVALHGKLHLPMLRHAGSHHASRHLRYDPDADEWEDLAPAHHHRSDAAMAAVDGRLIAAGGIDGGSGRLLDSVEAYDPDHDAWTPRASLPRPVAGAGAAEWDGMLYLFGGVARNWWCLFRRPSRTVRIYCPETDGWTRGPCLPAARAGVQVVRTEHHIHLVGGAPNARALALAPRDDTWLEPPQPQPCRSHGGLAALDGALYLLGCAVVQEQTAIQKREVEQLMYLHERTTP